MKLHPSAHGQFHMPQHFTKLTKVKGYENKILTDQFGRAIPNRGSDHKESFDAACQKIYKELMNMGRSRSKSVQVSRL